MADLDLVDGISIPTTYNPCSSSDEHLFTSSNRDENPRGDFGHENFSNGFNSGIGEADFQSQEMPFTGPLGFQNMLPVYRIDQIPPIPYGPLSLQQPWPLYQPPLVIGSQGLPTFNPHHIHVELVNTQPQWQAFEAPSQSEDVLVNHNSLDERRLSQFAQQNNWGFGGNPNSSNNFGGFAGGKSDLFAYEDKFRTQVAQYSMLPIDVHRRIQGMPACDIINYFEVTVVRVRLGIVLDRSDCHGVITTKPETRQCWLMAFSKESLAIKFNRLLIRTLNIQVKGKTGVEIQAISTRETGEYLFNFTDEKATKEFLVGLNIARSQIWNPEYPEQSHSGQFEPPPPPTFQPMDYLGFPAGQEQPQGIQPQPDISRRGDVEVSQTGHGLLHGKRWPQYSTEVNEKNEEINVGKESSDVIYSERAKLFAKCAEDYVVLGQGEMTIVENLSYDEVKFFGPNRKLLCSHKIYKWCDLESSKEGENKYICKWFAPAILSVSPSELPINRHLKMEVAEQGLLAKFCQVVSGCKEKALKLAFG